MNCMGTKTVGRHEIEVRFQTVHIAETSYRLEVTANSVYGVIRSHDGKQYDHTQHKSEYVRLATYVTNYS